MPAEKLTPTKRYYRPGIDKIYFVPTIVNKESPTRSELDAGDDLSSEVAEVNGFVVNSATIDTPDWGSRFASKIPAAIEADNSSLVFYEDRESQDIRAVLPRDTDGYFVFLDGGDVEGHMMDVFPGRVASVPKLRDRDQAARLEVQVTITSEPAENIAIPAHAA